MSYLNALARQFPGSELASMIERQRLQSQVDALTAARAEADARRPLGDPSKPAPGERWRDVYGMAPGPCGARTRSGALCRLPGAGCGGRCKFHGGASTGPRTAAGRARAALNGHANRMEKTMLQAAQPTVADLIDADAPAVPLAAPSPEVAPVGAAPRRPILEALLEAHLSGESRWPLIDRTLARAGGDVRLSRAELVDAVRAPGSSHIVDLLVRRGALLEVQQGRRLVLVPPRQ